MGKRWDNVMVRASLVKFNRVADNAGSLKVTRLISMDDGGEKRSTAHVYFRYELDYYPNKQNRPIGVTVWFYKTSAAKKRRKPIASAIVSLPGATHTDMKRAIEVAAENLF